jgi:D-beta-D-heptose 7-phosphate kinase / D-beta-D-heptose 1-phosphate adenosyltransferase
MKKKQYRVMPHHEKILGAISRFSSLNVLVIGDFILDVFIKGISNRLCPEAPVPVVDVIDRLTYLGGAANTACNLCLLGANVTFCSVIGADAAGNEALSLLRQFGQNNIAVFNDTGRETIVKTRVVAGKQLITRFDGGTTGALSDLTADKLIAYLQKVYADFDVVILSDYDKGVITDRLVHALVRLQNVHKKFLAVDSKRLPFFRALTPSLVKPNYEEAIKLAGLMPQCHERASQMAGHEHVLREQTGADIIALTLDDEGSLIFQKGIEMYQARAPKVTSPQVAGAGDTFLSAFAMAYVISGDVQTSAETANAAAFIAIRKEATATCTAAELKCHFNMMAKHIANTDDLKELCAAYHEAGKRIVFTNGCFDILHTGHVTYLTCAKELGDVLIVGLNSDESIRRLKGEMRPVNPLSDRLQVLSGLTSVDHIITFGEESDDTPVNLISVVRPHVFVKGGDYRKEDLPELKLLESQGAEVVIIPSIPDRSTTNIINRMNRRVDLASISYE